VPLVLKDMFRRLAKLGALGLILASGYLTDVPSRDLLPPTWRRSRMIRLSFRTLVVTPTCRQRVILACAVSASEASRAGAALGIEEPQLILALFRSAGV